MPTRSNIIIKDDQGSIQLYRHSDGYPDGKHGVLCGLRDAIPHANMKYFEASEFSAAVVRAWKEGSGGIYIDGNPEGWELLHGDVEWVYVVEHVRGMSEPTVSVYEWGKYSFYAYTVEDDPPNPALVCTLSEAYQHGLDWDVEGDY